MDLINLITNFVVGLGVVVIFMMVAAIVTLMIVGFTQLAFALFAYVIPRMGLKVVRDYRSGNLPFKQLIDEMLTPADAAPALSAPKQPVEGEYQERTSSGTIAVRR